MKNILTIILISFGIGLVGGGCSKILDKSPLDQISDPEFWKSDQDLQLYVNQLYSVLPGWNLAGSGGTALLDASSDVAIAFDLFLYTKDRLDGVINIPSTGGGWTWTNVRNVNYFLDNVDRVPDGGMKEQYIGEGYFFRAWNYFDLMRKFGDLPIVAKALSPDDKDILFGARSSRTDVTNFIISDLDMAISKLKEKSDLPASRVDKDIATLLKARVCLYEGTWEKYHQGDAFKGKGNGVDFLTEAAEAAKAVIDAGNYSLVMGDPNQVYYELFNQLDYSQHSEVMLYRTYNSAAFGNDFGNDTWNWPNRSGLTKGMLEMYLCSDGLPSMVSPLYKGDHDIRDVVQNRDPRCVQTVMNPGDPVAISPTNDTTHYVTPGLTNNQTFCPTAYESQKFRRPQLDPATGTYSRNLAYIICRYAEALLIYAEARAELEQLTQADVDMTINKLRDRVGMPHMVLGSITSDPAWPDYGYSLPDYLYEIRRERAVELFSEGFRIDDIMRWKAHKLFVGTRPKGAYYTNELKAINPNLKVDADGYIDPYLNVLKGPNSTWGFDPGKHYLLPLPTTELTLNPAALTQNPGWQ